MSATAIIIGVLFLGLFVVAVWKNDE